MRGRPVLFLALGCGLSFPMVGFGEAKYPNLCRHIVGHWVGTSESVKNGKKLKYDIVLDVTEEPKRSRVRWEYSGRDPEPFTSVSYFKFEPDKERMWREYPDAPTEDRFRTQGLQTFAETGIGDFQALKSEVTMGRRMRLQFHVADDALVWEWQASTDGKNWLTYSLWSFHR